MSWDDLNEYACNLESECANLQRELAEANDYIESLIDCK